MRFWRWLLDKIKRIFDVSRSNQVIMETSKKNPPKKRRDFPVRFWNVPHYGQDMPKRQWCLKCGAMSKRIEKIVISPNNSTSGATYRCRTHGPWFVASLLGK